MYISASEPMDSHVVDGRLVNETGWIPTTFGLEIDSSQNGLKEAGARHCSKSLDTLPDFHPVGGISTYCTFVESAAYRMITLETQGLFERLLMWLPDAESYITPGLFCFIILDEPHPKERRIQSEYPFVHEFPSASQSRFGIAVLSHCHK